MKIPLSPSDSARVVLLGLALAVSSCSESTSPATDESASADSTSPTTSIEDVEVSENTQKTLADLFGKEQKKPDSYGVEHPELDFEDASGDLPSTGTWREHPLLADLNSDGLDDLVASNREEDGLNVWLRTADGGWKLSIDGIERNLMYGGSEAADLNGDGRVDLVFASHKLTTRVFLNRPVEDDPKAIRWEEVEEALECTFLGLDVALGNLNGDEHVDAVTISQFAVDRSAGGMGIYFGRGDGTFERQTQHSAILGKSRCGHQVELSDLDGNGLDDLFVTAEWGVRVFMTFPGEADGTITFEDRSEGLPVPESIGNQLYAFIPCELTGAPPLEVAFAGLADPKIKDLKQRNDVGAYRLVGTRWEQFDEGLPRHLAYRDILSADFDADGHGDLVLSGPGIGAVLYMGDGSGKFEALGMFAGTLAGGRGSIGDVDSDGRPDITITCGATKARPDAGGVRVFLNRARAFEN